MKRQEQKQYLILFSSIKKSQQQQKHHARTQLHYVKSFETEYSKRSIIQRYTLCYTNFLIRIEVKVQKITRFTTLQSTIVIINI